jgi:very-short-patch-repair endonuclease
LRAKQLEGLKFRRQEPIGKYIADFACHEKRIVIEVDGGQHYPPLNPLPSREGKVVCDTWLVRRGKRIEFWGLPSREGKVVCDTPIEGWESTHLK